MRYHQIRAGHPDPFQGSRLPRLDYVLKGIKRHQARSGTKARTRLPITPLLRRPKDVWEESGGERDTKLIWAVNCLCLYGFLRAGEMVVPSDSGYDPHMHLNLADIALDDSKRPSLVWVSIKQSKTDPFCRGSDIFVGRTGTDLCPVSALLDYLQMRGSAPGPLFIFADSHLLTRQLFVDTVREGLEKAGVDQSHYCRHGFRIGAATTAATKGEEDCVIQALGRWESLVYLRYVRLPREQLSGCSVLLAF